MQSLTTFVFCIMLCNGMSFALPKNWPSTSYTRQEYNWNGKDRQDFGKGFGDDSDAEMIPSTILEQHEEYNVVRYPSSKWVCTKEMVDVSSDPLENWRDTFGDNPMAAMMAMKKSSPSSKMFKKLFRYIIGVNSEQENIEMTRPVTTIRKSIKGRVDMELETMCFWTGTPWENKKLPDPIDDSVFIQNRPEITVFVRRFGGWALSQKKWKEEKQKLMRSLGSRMKEVNLEYYATVGYDSPWVQDRRNEVWLVKQKGTYDIKKPGKNTAQVGNSANREGSDLETVPYEVLESKQNYEVRQYPATKWICNTDKSVTPSADVMNGWQEKYDNNPLRAMSSRGWKKQASSKMFMKLFKYISGANSMGVEIDMTTPVPTKHTSTGNDKEEQQMCFWLGSKWQNKPAPAALGKDLETTRVVQGQAIKVYVRRFGGFAMSQDDWHSQYKLLEKDLKKDGAIIKGSGEFYHLSYDSPFVMENRRNEIWIEAQE